MSEDMLAFERMISEQDHVEGLRINEVFDEQLAVDRPEAALAAAIEQTETDLSAEYEGDMPGVELYGYSIAKNARRWWMYGVICLRDLDKTAASDPALKDQAAFYGKEKNHAGEKLEALDPAYFKTFDLLERERVRLHLNSRTDVNPFDMARDYGALVLSETLGAAFDRAAASDGSEAGTKALKFRGLDAVYVIERTPDKRAKSYIINELPDDTQQISDKPRTVYIVDGPRNPSGQPTVMRTSGWPLVAACRILDLANAVTGYNESLENAVFERVESVLAARREAES